MEIGPAQPVVGIGWGWCQWLATRLTQATRTTPHQFTFGQGAVLLYAHCQWPIQKEVTEDGQT